MHKIKKHIAICCIGISAILIAGFVIVGNFLLRNDESHKPINRLTDQLINSPAIPAVAPVTSTILFVGDMMFDRYVAKKINEAQDPLLPFAKIKEFLDTADFLVGNLEGPISARGKNQGSAYSFRFEPVGTTNALKYAGFDLLNLANNHIYDYGLTASKDTMQHLTDAGISYIGFGKNLTEANSPVIKKIGSANVAFLGYTEFYGSPARAGENNAGLSTWNEEEIISAIKKARVNQEIDLIILNVHWGIEYKTKSNARQQELAHKLIDAGADLIVGHHPHVAQEVENYSPFTKGRGPLAVRDLDSKSLPPAGVLPFIKGDRKGFIAYSLGNFVFDQNFSVDTRNGLVLEVVLNGKEIEKVIAHPVNFTKSFQPFIAKP